MRTLTWVKWGGRTMSMRGVVVERSRCMVEGERRRRCARNPLYTRTVYPKRELGSQSRFQPDSRPSKSTNIFGQLKCHLKVAVKFHFVSGFVFLSYSSTNKHPFIH